MNNIDKLSELQRFFDDVALSELQSFFDDVEDVLIDASLNYEESYEKLIFLYTQYKIKLHNIKVLKGD